MNPDNTEHEAAHHDQPRPMPATEVSPRHGVAFVVFAVGGLITACMAVWFATYVFQALNGDLTLTDQVRGANAAKAADEARGSEPGSFWFLVALWSAAFVGSAHAALRCTRLAMQLRKSLSWQQLISRA